jgi:hypothetical protein
VNGELAEERDPVRQRAEERYGESGRVEAVLVGVEVVVEVSGREAVDDEAEPPIAAGEGIRFHRLLLLRGRRKGEPGHQQERGQEAVVPPDEAHAILLLKLSRRELR